MKKFFTILFALAMTCTSIFAQERYLDEVFTDVTVTSDVTYGVNATVLFLPQIGEAAPIPLMMDVYEPAGDTEVERPLVLVFHTGNFLPNVTNGQIAGTRTDSSAVEICTQLAKRGYVAASVSYRSGWNPLAQTQPERALGLIQAAYRGMQDGRTAIRYFRKTAAEDNNPFGVDTERITVFGTGTGGYLTLGLVGLSDYNEIVQTTNGPGKFLLDTDGDQVPETAMVVPAFHGDINGEVLTVVPFDGFGLPAGDTTNYVNHAGYSNDFNLGVNVGGALGDISWLDDNTTPTISIQSAFDIFAPYDDAVLVVPTTNDPIVQVQGAQQIGAAQLANGANSVWDEATFDDAVTAEAIANSATAGHPYYEGVYPYIQPPNSAGLDEGVVIDWWVEDSPSPVNGQGMGFPWNQLPHPSGGTFHSNGLLLNEGMSAEKARGNIANIMAYTLPRACVALDLPCKDNFLDTSTKNLSGEVAVSISPNPATDVVNFLVSDQTFPIIGYQLFDMNGRLMTEQNNLNTSNLSIQRNALPVGMYVAKLQFEDGIVSKKIMFK